MWMGTFVTFTGDMSVPEEKRMLFNRYMQRILDIGGIMDLSRVELDFDEEEYNREKEERRKERMKKYEGCVKGILEQLLKYKEMTLEILNTVCTEEERTQLLPTAEIFREVIIEFLTAGTIDIGALQDEQSDYLMDASDGFVLNEMLLGLMEDREFRKIGKMFIFPMEDSAHVYFKNVMDENGNRRNFRCSNVGFRYEER